MGTEYRRRLPLERKELRNRTPPRLHVNKVSFIFTRRTPSLVFTEIRDNWFNLEETRQLGVWGTEDEEGEPLHALGQVRR